MSRRAASRVAARRLRGMTLVELMVGLAVGLFVSLIAIAVFVSTRTLNAVNSSGARMGENARLAMEALQEDLRSAGFVGCQDPLAAPPASALNAAAAAAAGFLAAGDGGFAGFRGTGSGFAPALSAALAALAVPPSGDSDIVSVRVPVDNLAFNVTGEMATAADPLQIGAPGPGAGTLLQGDIVLVSNCKSADIFQLTGANPGLTGTLEHTAGGGSVPGNAAADLSRRYRPPGRPFDEEATVYRLRTHHYYVAPSRLHPDTRSMWRLVVPCPECPANSNPQELASGIERLNIAWGLDTDATPDRVVNRYVAADAVGSWSQVVSARVQMLVATAQNGMTQNAAASVAFAGSSVVPGDRRLRTVLSEVVSLRNRAP